MALFKFTDLMMKNKPINVFNFGNMIRDFTYIDDLIQAMILLIKKLPKGNKLTESKFYNASE